MPSQASPSTDRAAASKNPTSSPASPAPLSPRCSFRRSTATNNNGNKKRYVFECDSRPIYEWEQSLDEVVLYVPAPPGLPRSKASSFIECKIGANGLRLGLKNSGSSGGSPPTYFINEATFGTVNVDESTWTLEEEEQGLVIAIYLAKANLGVVWESALNGPPLTAAFARSSSAAATAPTVARLDPAQLEEVRQQLMLERWTKENPGMDFSLASFSGAAPDPRTFMDGTKYE